MMQVRWLNRILAGLASAAIVLGAVLPARAQEPDSVEVVAQTGTGSVTIPVSQTFALGDASLTRLYPGDLTVHYTITQVEDDYDDGGEQVDPASFDLTYDKNSQNVTFTATHAGVYTYTLTVEDKKAAYYTYDRTTYTIRQYVKNTEDGGLETFLTAENEDGKKVSKVIYRHVYTNPRRGSHDKGQDESHPGSNADPAEQTTHITAFKQWANVDGIELPESATFALVKDGVTTEATQTVSANNDWTADFGLLPTDGTSYTVTELDVPENYSMSVETVIAGSEVTYTITNTYIEPGADHQNRFTGDESQMTLYGVIMSVTAILLGGWAAMNRRREQG